jgi:hypothetical protein
MEEVMSFKKSLLLLVACFSLSANAGFLVEPYLGYKMGSGDRSTNPTTDIDYSSPTFGARLGYQFLGLMAGVDYSLASFDLTQEQSGSSDTVNSMKQSTFGLFVGYDFPILLRAWGAMYFDSNLEDDDSRNSNLGDEFGGDGYGLGVGFTGLPFVSINLEYRSLSYDDFTDASNSANDGTLANPYDVSEIILSVSLPLDL